MEKCQLRNLAVEMTDASDIIAYEIGSTRVENLMTGRRGNLISEVTRDKRFIMASVSDLENGLNGYYAKHIKQNEIDALIFINAVFYRDTCKWAEIDRHAFYCEGNDNEIHYVGPAQTFSKVCNGTVDICGQAVIEDYESDMVWTKLDMRNVNSGFREQTLSFLQGDIYFFDWQDYQFSSANILEDIGPNELQKIVTFNSINGKVCRGYIAFCDSYVSKKMALLPDLPEEAFQKMSIIAYSKVLYGREKKRIVDNFLLYHQHFYCLQNVEGKAWLRTFSMRLIAKNPLKNSVIIPVEIERLCLDNDGYDKGDNKILYKMMPLVYADDMIGTHMEYNCGLIKEWISDINACMGDDKDETAKKILEAEETFEKKNGISPELLVTFARILSVNPAMERLYKAEFKGCEALKKYVLLGAFKSDKDVEKAFGIIDTKASTLNSMLKIPKGMLEKAAETDTIQYIVYAKQMFSGNMDYLARMNKEDAYSLICFLKSTTSRDSILNIDITVETMSNLFEVFGCENWKSYAKYIVGDLQSYRYLSISYNEYTDVLTILDKEIAKKLGWKIQPEKMNDAVEMMRKYRKLAEESKEYEIFDKKIKKLSGTFSKFSYENDEFMISYPKNSYEIAWEGVTLNHCVADFIEAAATGITNILFIRRKTCPDKPFFTLEIRDGAVRQCHGFNNCCIDDEEGLPEFLEKFCEEKDVIYNDGRELINV